MKLIFCLSLIGVLYTYAGYPVMMWMLSRLRPRPWMVAPITPSVSIVLAVHNGVALLPQKIEHLLGLDYSNIQQIIIVSDGSTDGTAELLASEGLLQRVAEGDYAVPTAKLMERRETYVAEMMRTLESIKPAFNEEMRSGSTNM